MEKTVKFIYIINKTYFCVMKYWKYALVVSTIAIYVGCTPPVFQPPVSEENTVNPSWGNTGKVNASFIATSRNLAVNANTGSPTFQISFIASSSNIDSLNWSFPGGVLNDSISEVAETVSYDAYGQYDVGLEVFNIEDEDSRYYQNFIEIFYRDDFIFTDNDTTTWIVTGTGVSPSDFEPSRDNSGNPYDYWSVIPFSKAHRIIAEKTFENLPSNNLILEFDYKLERVPVIYLEGSSISGYSSASPTTVTYVEPMARTVSDTRVNSPLSYPGAKRFSFEYNNIPIWVSSRVNEEYFEHIRLELPSVSDFKLSMVKEAQEMIVKEIPFPMDALPIHNPTIYYTSTHTLVDDIDRDGIPNVNDLDDDGDGYLDLTERFFDSSTSVTVTISDPTDDDAIPKYVIQHVRYPYNVNIRNITIRVNPGAN